MNSDRAAKLRARLATAREREAELKAEIKKLERKADIAYSTICNIEEELAELEVRSWGGIPSGCTQRSRNACRRPAHETAQGRLGMVQHPPSQHVGLRLDAPYRAQDRQS